MIRFFKSAGRFFLSTTLGGFFLILPLSATVFLLILLYDYLSKALRHIALKLSSWLSVDIFLANLLISLLFLFFCFLLGLFIRTGPGKGIFRFMERIFFMKLPGYRFLKEVVTQLSRSKKHLFSCVGLADVFNNSSYMTVFIMDKSENWYTVFAPSGPNPTTGSIYHIPRHRIIETSEKVEVGLKTIIGMGSGSRRFYKFLEKNAGQ